MPPLCECAYLTQCGYFCQSDHTFYKNLRNILLFSRLLKRPTLELCECKVTLLVRIFLCWSCNSDFELLKIMFVWKGGHQLWFYGLSKIIHSNYEMGDEIIHIFVVIVYSIATGGRGSLPLQEVLMVTWCYQGDDSLLLLQVVKACCYQSSDSLLLL